MERELTSLNYIATVQTDFTPTGDNNDNVYMSSQFKLYTEVYYIAVVNWLSLLV